MGSSSSISSIERVRGMRDIMGDEARLYRRLVSCFAGVVSSYGYEEILVPFLEDASLFERGLGASSDVVSKEMYRFCDQGGQMVTLRPEGTAGVMRAFLAMGQPSLPQRLFYEGAMFRRERPQKGRYRQFHQLGIELIGDETVVADVEVILCADDFLKKCGIKSRLLLNSLGDEETRQKWRAALVTHFTKYKSQLSEVSQMRLVSNPLRILDSKEEGEQELIKDAPLIDDYYSKESASFFDELRERLSALGVVYERAPHLVRGLDYYGHTAFEYCVADGLGAQNTVLAGGRYDGLAQLLGGRMPSGSVAAVGFAAGIDRLMLIIGDDHLPPLPLFMVLPASHDDINEALMLAQELREHGGTCLFDGRGGLAKRLDRARKKGVSHVFILGEDERQKNEVTLRSLNDSKQARIKRGEVKKTMARILARDTA